MKKAKEGSFETICKFSENFSVTAMKKGKEIIIWHIFQVESTTVILKVVSARVQSTFLNLMVEFWI